MTAFPNVAERISEAHHGISGRRLTFLVLLLALSCGVLTAGGLVQAMPKDGKVIAGGADIVQSTPNRLDINQRSANAVIDWRSFSIDVDEHTHFRQPSASSMTLNRVRGDSYSNLLGKLTANGRVMLLNPNGILFGKTAVVDVAGLVATTIDIRNEDFMAGRFNFAINHNPGGTVVNRGRITAAEGGLVALVAPGVENSGVIRARLGRVALASGNAFTFDLHGDSLIRLRVDDRVAERLTAPDGAPLAALVDNSGTINADGGAVWLAASAAKDVVDRVINMDGIVEARSVGMRNGHIQLLGNGEGIVRVAGKLDASGKGRGETGGSVKVLGEKVGVVEQAKIDASGHSGGGTTLIGGNFQGKGPERNAEYATVGGDVTIRADATGTGNGGKVIVWSERVTRFLGSISARGGTHSGDGGFAEVSGKRHLQFAAAAVDLRAPGGSAGELLLDPRDITISDGDGTNNNEVSADGEISFGSDSNDYNIQPVAFEAIDGDVTLQAQRDMTVSSPIDRSGSSSSTLSLQAGRHLTINAAITGTNGAHNFIFEADSPRSGNNDGIGTLTIGSSGSITSNNGDVTLIGAGFAIDLASSIDAGTGDIHVAPSQSVLMTISAGAGNLSNAEIGRFVTSGSIIIGTATTGPTGTGQAGSSIVASAITVGESLSIGGSASLVVRSSGTITLAADIRTNDGNITFTGPVTLTGDVTVNSDANADGTAGAIRFTSTIDGGQALSLDADTGAIQLVGAVGGTTAVASLTVTGGAVSLRAVTATGNIDVTGGTIIRLVGEYQSNDGDVTFTGPVTLAGAVRVDSDANADGTAGAIRFTLTINSKKTSSGQDLDLDAGSGAITLGGAVGGRTPVTSFTVTTSGAVSLAAVTATGNIHVTGGTIRLAGAYRSDDGHVTFTGPVTLGWAVTVNSDADDDSTDGDIQFTSTIDGGQALEVDSGSGTTTLGGAVGGTTPVASLTVSGVEVLMAGVRATGKIDVKGGTGRLAGAYRSDDGNITFAVGTVALTGDVTVDSDADNDGTDGAIRFASTINGGYALTLDADTGVIRLAAAVGGRTPVASLTVTAGSVSLAAVRATGAVAVTTGGTIRLAGAYRSDDGNITFTGSVVLTGAVTVNSDADNDGRDGNIAFSLNINGWYALTLDADTGAIRLVRAVGGGTMVKSLTVVTSGTVSLAAVKATGAVAVTGGTIRLDGQYQSNDGNITFTGPVTLAGAVRVDSDADDDSTDGAIAFTSTIDGGYALSLDADTGVIRLAGAVGGRTPVASLKVRSGAVVVLPAVTATGAVAVTARGITLAGAYRSNDGNITFTGPVTLAGDVTVNSDQNNSGTDGAIRFTSTINGGQALSLDADTGAIRLVGAVGGTTAVASLTVTGGAVELAAVTATGAVAVTGTTRITLAADIATSDGNITFTGPVTLANFVWVDSNADNDDTAGAIEFTSTIDGGQVLGLDAETGAITLAGTVGGTTRVTSLKVRGGAVSLAAVTATGDIEVTARGLTLAGNVLSNDGHITFTGPVTLAGAVTVNSDADDDGTDGAIRFTSTIDGGYALSLDADTGAITLAGTVGGATAVTSLTVTGGAVSLATVLATGNMAVTGTGLTLAGNVFSSDGNITFTGPVTLARGVRVNSDADGAGTDGAIAFTSTIDGGYALSLDADTGAITLAGAVGGTTAVASLTVTGGAVSLAAVTATGDIDVTGTGIRLAGAYRSDDGHVTFTGPVTLTGAVTVDSDANDDSTDGAIEFTSTINGGQALSLDADTGAITLVGAVGGTTAVASLTVAGGAVSLAAVTATGAVAVTGTGLTLAGEYRSDDGNMTFTGPVTLTGAVTVDSDADDDSTDGAIRFTSTIDGGQALVLDADTGTITLAGVGGSTPVASLTVTTSGAVALLAVTATGDIDVTARGITLAGNVLSSDGNITFTGPVTLTGAVTVNSDADDDGTDGVIRFTSTINGGQALTLDADTGAIRLVGAVGGSTAVASLTVTGGAVSLAAVTATGAVAVTGTGLRLAGAYRSDDGNMIFTGPVTLAGAVTVNSDADDDGTDGAIRFTSTIDGGQALSLDADTGAITLVGAVGGRTAVASLTVVTSGAVSLAAVTATGDVAVTGTGLRLAGAYRSDDGKVTFTGPVTLAGAVTVNSDADDDSTDGVRFTSTIDGGYALSLDADTDAITLVGAVGGTTPVASLTVTGGAVSLAAVTATGAVDVRGIAGITLAGAVEVTSLTVATRRAVSLAAVTATGAVAVTGTGITLAGNVLSNDGHVTFTGPVTLAGAVTVNSDANDDGTDGAIRFTSTIDGGYALSLDADTGAITLVGAVGGRTAVASLTVATRGAVALAGVRATGAVAVTGTGLTLAGAYRSDDGNMTFTGPVTLAGAVRVDSDANGDSTDGAIRFTSTIDGGQALVLDADTGTITLVGAVGGTTAVTSLTVVTAGAVALAGVRATGDIDVRGTGLTLAGVYRSDDGNMIFTGPVTLAGAVRVDSDANDDGTAGVIRFTSTIDGGYALTLDADTGAITLVGAVGGTTAVTSLTVAGGAVSLAAVTATGAVAVTGTGLTLAGAVEVTSLTVTGGAVSLAAVTATGNIAVTGTTSLTLAGVYRSDDGNVIFTGPVTLAGAVRVDSDANDDGTDGVIRFTSTIDGGYALTLDADTGAITLVGAVGGTTAVTSLTVAGGAVSLAAVRATGAVAVTGTGLTLAGVVEVTSLTVTGGAVSLAAVTATGNIAVTGTTRITLAGAYRSDDGNVTFTGPVTLAGAVTVNSDADDDGTDGVIRFTSTIDGGQALSLDADTGAITLVGAVGGATAVTSLTVTGGAVSLAAVTATGNIAVTATGLTLAGNVLSSDGHVIFTGPVTLAGAVTVNSDANDDSTDGDIRFTSTIDGGYALTLAAGSGTITLAGAVGGTTTVTSLTVTGGAVSLAAVTVTGAVAVTGTGLTLAGNVLSNDGNVIFTGPVTLAGAVTVNSDANDDGTDGVIRFTSTIDGGYALSLDADTGAIRLVGAVGGSTAVASLTVTTSGAVALAAVTATGAVAVTGMGLTLAGNVLSSDGHITFTGPVTLAGAVTVNSDADYDGTDGAIEFTSTIDGGYALSLDADTGAIRLAGVVGGSTAVASLTVMTSGAVALPAVTATGAVAVRGTGLTLAGNVLSSDGHITFTGPVTLAGAVTVNSDADGDGTAGAIEFTSTIDGGYALSLDADTGAITLAGAVGGTTPVASLTVRGGAVALAAVTATGDIDVTATGLTLAGNVLSNDGNVTFTGPVTLANFVWVNSDADADGTGGDIEFTSTIDGGQVLELDADTGAITLVGAVGGTTAVTSLTVTGGAVALVGVTATGAVAVTGTGLTLAGVYRSDDGNVTFTGPVTLAGAVTVDSDANADGTDGGIEFTSTIDGGYALTLDADTGAITLAGAVGGTTAVASLTVTTSGAVVALPAVTATGDIDVTGTGLTLAGAYRSDDGHVTFTGPVTLADFVWVNSDANTDGTDGDIEFTSTIDGGYALGLDADTGAITLAGAVGGTTPVASLTVRGGAVALAAVTATGDMAVTGTTGLTLAGVYRSDDGNVTFTGPVTLAGAVTVNSDANADGTAGAIRFTSTIDGGQALSLDADTGAIQLVGAVGGTTAVASLTVTGGAVALAAVTATGDMDVTGTGLTLAGAYRSDDGDVTFTGPVTLAGAVTVNSDANGDGTAGAIEFTSTIDGGQALSLDADTGAITLAGAVGGTTAVTSLTVTGGAVALAAVTATGDIDVTGTGLTLAGAYRSDDGNVTFTGPVTLAGAVTVNSDANADGTDGDIRFTSTIDGGYALSLDADTGTIHFEGDVGSTAKLGAMTITKAHDVTVGTSMRVTSFQQLAGTGTSDFGFSTLYSDTFVNVSTKDIKGRIIAKDVTLKSSNHIGVTVEVDSLTIEAKSVDIKGTVGGEAGTGNMVVTATTGITLAGEYSSDDGTITFTGPVTLAGDVTVNSDADGDGTAGDIEFTSTIDGGYALTLDADTGAITLAGAVGGTTAVASLTVAGGAVALAAVTATGDIDVTGTGLTLAGVYRSDDGNMIFTGPVTLAGDVTVNSDANGDGTDGAIEFTSTIDGGQALVLDADTGAITLAGAVGGTTPVASLTVAGGAVLLAAVTATGAVDVRGIAGLTLAGAVKVTSLTVRGGAVALAAVTATGDIDVTGTGLTLAGAYRSNDGDVTFTGPVTLAGAVTVNSDANGDGTDGAIRFTSTIDGGQALVLDADTGAITLVGAVGGTTAVASLTVAGGAVALAAVTATGDMDVTGTTGLTLAGVYRSDDGNVTFTGPVTLAGAVTVNSDANADSTAGAIRFTSTIDGGQALSLDADTGAITLVGAVGGTTAVTSLTVTGGAVALAAVTATGDMDVTGTTGLTLAGAYRSDDGHVTFTGPVTLAGAVTVNSDANADGTDGDIRFTSTIDGGYALSLDADTGTIHFEGDVGSTAKLGAMTITKAHDVTVGTSMRVTSFQQLAGTGTSDFGFSTLYSDTFVNVSTKDIKGRIIAKDVTLKSSNHIGVTVEVDSLTIEAKSVDIKGTVGGEAGQGAASKTIIRNKVPGMYKLNDFTSLGIGPEIRQYAELAALPLPNTTWRWGGAPGDVVFLPFSPILRASVMGAMDRSYPVNVFEMPFALLKPQTGMESIYDTLPGGMRDVWRHLGTDAMMNTHGGNDEDHYKR